jgi:hypothetical protein
VAEIGGPNDTKGLGFELFYLVICRNVHTQEHLSFMESAVKGEL